MVLRMYQKSKSNRIRSLSKLSYRTPACILVSIIAMAFMCLKWRFKWACIVGMGGPAVNLPPFLKKLHFQLLGESAGYIFSFCSCI